MILLQAIIPISVAGGTGLDTCANEAIPRQGMGGLISHLYLQRPAQSTLKCVASSIGRKVQVILLGCGNLTLHHIVQSSSHQFWPSLSVCGRCFSQQGNMP